MQRGQLAPPPIEHVPQSLAQIYFCGPSAAAPELGNIAGDDWFITTAHQRRILLHGEGDFHAGLNSLNYLLN